MIASGPTPLASDGISITRPPREHEALRLRRHVFELPGSSLKVKYKVYHRLSPQGKVQEVDWSCVDVGMTENGKGLMLFGSYHTFVLHRHSSLKYVRSLSVADLPYVPCMRGGGLIESHPRLQKARLRFYLDVGITRIGGSHLWSMRLGWECYSSEE